MEKEKMYALRDERGTMKAKFPEAVAQHLAFTVKGQWLSKPGQNGSLVRSYHVEENMKVNVLMPTDSQHSVPPAIGQVYLWKGDVIVEPTKA